METQPVNEPKNEKNGVVLFVDYDNGCRSVAEFNERLSRHYCKEINLDRDEIVNILARRAQMMAIKFNPDEIIE